MKRNISLLGLVAIVLALSSSAFADNILVQNFPWGSNAVNEARMTDVFGAGNFTAYDFVGAIPGTIFSGTNAFVFLEGGDGSDVEWDAYIGANSAAILAWVTAGGRLLLQSASYFEGRGNTTLGPGTITGGEADLSDCGTLTAAGTAAFTFGGGTAAFQCGNYLSHDYITGSGLTVYMNSDAGNPNVAGTAYGSGYIMYSGLTFSDWHDDGPSLENNVICTAAGAGCGAAVPEPASLSLLGTGLLGLATVLLRKRRA